MKATLTAQGIKSLRPGPAVDIWDTITPGLIVRVGAKKITYGVRFSVGSGRVRQVIGPVDAITLAAARRTAREIIDASNRPEVYADRTFADLADEYIEKYARPNKRTWADDAWMLKKYVLPEIGATPVGKVERGDLLKLLEGIATGKGNPRGPAPVQSNRVRAVIHKLFRWAVSTGRAEVNPAADMHKFGKERCRDRILDDNELWALWAAFDASTSPLADLFKLLLLTGQRLGEVQAMRWSEIDLNAAHGPTWTLPAARTKAARRHYVPLAPAAVRILERIRENQIDDERRRARRQRRDPVADRFVFPSRRDRFAPVVSVKTTKAQIEKAAALDERWGLHDLRRTAATKMVELGVAESIVSRILNHAARGITAKVYVHASFDAEKRAALVAWDRRVMTIAYGIEAVEAVEAGS